MSIDFNKVLDLPSRSSKKLRREVVDNTLALYRTLDFWLSLQHYSQIVIATQFLANHCGALGFPVASKPTNKQLASKVSAWADFDKTTLENHLVSLKVELKLEKIATARTKQLLKVDRLDDINVASLKEVLSITDAELKRWKDDGRIPIKRHESFYKWGKTLMTTVHSVAEIAKISPEIIADWRATDIASGKARKSRATVTPIKKVTWGFELSRSNKHRTLIAISIDWFGETRSWELVVYRSVLLGNEALWAEHWASVVDGFNFHVKEQARQAETLLKALLDKRPPEDQIIGMCMLEKLKSLPPASWPISTETTAKHYFWQADHDRRTKEILGEELAKPIKAS